MFLTVRWSARGFWGSAFHAVVDLLRLALARWVWLFLSVFTQIRGAEPGLWYGIHPPSTREPDLTMGSALRTAARRRTCDGWFEGRLRGNAPYLQGREVCFHRRKIPSTL